MFLSLHNPFGEGNIFWNIEQKVKTYALSSYSYDTIVELLYTSD